MCVYIIHGHNNVGEVCIGKAIRMSIVVMMWAMELAYLDDLWLLKRQTPLNSWGLSCLSSVATVNFIKCYGPYQMFGLVKVTQMTIWFSTFHSLRKGHGTLAVRTENESHMLR